MRQEIGIKLGEFFFLVPEEQKMRVCFCDMSLEGTQDSISCATSKEFNNLFVENVEAEDDVLKVWVKYDEDA